MLKIASFNVNSIRARLPQLIVWLKNSKPDVVCLQEIKCQESEFPFEQIYDCGYNAAVYGQKTYNGVAILSKFQIEDVVKGLSGLDEEVAPEFAAQARYIEAVISCKKNALRIASIYVPNGGGDVSKNEILQPNQIPRSILGYQSKLAPKSHQILRNSSDAQLGSELLSSAKFQFKTNFLSTLKKHLQKLASLNEIQVFGGDFNVACSKADIYNPDEFEGKILFHPLERQKMNEILNLGLIDSFRQIYPQSCAYSWWDYRGNSWNLNKGARIDYLFLSPLASDYLKSAEIEDKGVRDQEKASDHCPISIELKIN